MEDDEASPREGKKFAQIGAVGLVRREIRHPCGKFFLAAVQAARKENAVRRIPVASPPSATVRTMSMKKKRVLPMFFFMRMSVCGVGDFPRRRKVVAFDARCRHAVGTAMEKKLREGVDTLKNRD